MQVLPPEPRYLHGRHSQHATLSPALTLPPASFVCVIMCGMPWFSLASTASRKKLLGVLPDAPSPKRSSRGAAARHRRPNSAREATNGKKSTVRWWMWTV